MKVHFIRHYLANRIFFVAECGFTSCISLADTTDSLRATTCKKCKNRVRKLNQKQKGTERNES